MLHYDLFPDFTLSTTSSFWDRVALWYSSLIRSDERRASEDRWNIFIRQHVTIPGVTGLRPTSTEEPVYLCFPVIPLIYTCVYMCTYVYLRSLFHIPLVFFCLKLWVMQFPLSFRNEYLNNKYRLTMKTFEGTCPTCDSFLINDLTEEPTGQFIAYHITSPKNTALLSFTVCVM